MTLQSLTILKTMLASNMGNLISRIILGIVTPILFLTIFMLSDRQHWPVSITIGLAVILFIIVNVSFTWLFWQKRKQRLNEEEDD